MQLSRKTTGQAFWKLLLTVFGLIFLFHSCQDDEICEDLTANDLRIGFYTIDQEGDQWALVDSLRVFALEKSDQPIHDTLRFVSVIELPLNPSADSCGFVLDFFHLTDTIWLTYERETHLISVECGFTMFFDIKETIYSTNHIISLEESTTYVTSDLDEHLKVFLPAAVDDN